MSTVINYILGLGAGIFLPVVMIILGLCIRMKPKRAIIAGLTLGVAFTGMNVVLNFMTGSVSPAASAFVNNTGIKLNAIDVGWSPISSIAWAWPYALLLFPLQIGINIAMLAFGWTNCLNVDLWNVWNKILTSVIVVAVTKSVPLAFVASSIEIIFELKNADLTQRQIYKITKIPGVACPHSMNLFCIILAPINRLMDFIPGLKNSNMDASKLKEKIGVFGENSVMGFIIGAGIAAFGGYDLKGILTTAVEVATSLVLFPMVAKLFMQALAPIADAAGEFMKKRFKGREFYIGLDWPFMAGSSELWVTMILLVPFEVGFAILMAKMGLNNVLPLGGVMAMCIAVPTLVITGGNIIRMLIMGILAVPLNLIIATQFSVPITALAKQVGTIKLAAGQGVTWFGLEAPVFRWAISNGLNIVNGNIVGFVLLIAYFALCVWYYKYMSKREEELKEEQ